MERLTQSCSMAAALGVLSHLLYFIRGEHHAQALGILQSILFLLAFVLLGLVQLLHYSVSSAVRVTALVTSSYIGSLWLSMIVYRLFFHPLKRFPGPTLAKVSKFYHSLCCWKLDNHCVRAKWHERYGDIVRIGERFFPQLLVVCFGLSTGDAGHKR